MRRQTARFILALWAGSAAAAMAANSVKPTIDVKFRDSSVVRFRNGQPQSIGGVALSTMTRSLLADLAAAKARWTPLFTVDERTIDSLRVKAGSKGLLDLNNWFRLSAPSSDGNTVISKLDQLPEVEYAGFSPRCARPPTIPNFSVATNSTGSYQQYLDSAASGGIDARYAWTLPGGRGTNVTLCDVEWDLDFYHADLWPSAASPLLVELVGGPTMNTDPLYRHHGTAMMSIAGGYNDSRGVTGVAHEADLKFVAEWSTSTETPNPADAVLRAAMALNAGDVMLLEQQTDGPNRPAAASDLNETGLVAAEWDRGTFGAITLATALKIIVVEAAGNGWQDYSRPEYDAGTHAPFKTNAAGQSVNDSGAIIVGAGVSPLFVDNNGKRGYDRQSWTFSNYGRRVDVQGWGDSVVCGGYGTDAPAVGMVNLWNENAHGQYAIVSGTSPATAMVAGAVTSIQSIYKQKWGSTLTPAEMRDLLKATGLPQNPRFDNPTVIAEPIGPLPNLKMAGDAARGILAAPRISPAYVVGETVSSTRPKVVTISLPDIVNTSLVQLYYTIDNTNPGLSSTGAIHGTAIAPGASITLTAPAIVKAWCYMPARAGGGPMRNVAPQSEVKGVGYGFAYPAPVVNIPSGCYPGLLSVDLRSGTSDGSSWTIIYTLDGTEPDENAAGVNSGPHMQKHWNDQMSHQGQRLAIFDQISGEAPVTLRAKNIFWFNELGFVVSPELVVTYNQLQPGASTCP